MSTPNLLVFLTDDHGQWAANCYGASELRTPALDSLAASGTRLTGAYTPCPVCSPARASFWTGRLPSQHGVHDWIHEPTRSGVWLNGERTLAEVLKAAGYQTGFFGKWHCGQSWVPQPGFDRYLGENKEQYPHRGVCKFALDGKPVEWVGHRSQFVTQQAMAWLAERDRKRPFFAFVGLTDTHSPFADHPKRLVDAYRDAAFSVPNERYVGAAVRTPGKLPEAKEHRRRLAQYAAAVETIDDQVGTLLDALDGDGSLDETLVLYTSDHGHMNGHHGLYFKGNATSPQNFYDESILVPSLWRWPKRIAAGQVRGEPAGHCDVFQTLLDAAGCPESGEAATKRTSPGASLLPMLAGGPASHDAAICEYGNARMIRTATAKLIVRYAPHVGDEFYDLKRDPRERRNAIADPKHASIIAGLRSRLDAHFAKYTVAGRAGIDPLPSFNNNEPWR